MSLPITFITRETRNNLHGVNAILGCLEKYVDPELCYTAYSEDAEDLVRTAEHASGQGRLPVIAWSFHTPETEDVQKNLNHIKQCLVHTEVKFIAGGAHASACPESTLAMGFDFVFCGEGEKLILDFINGLIVQDETILKSRIIRSLENEYISLDLYPAIPERSLKLNPVEITRGCIYGCSFCQTSYLFGKKFRHRSEETILGAAELLIRRGGHFLRMTTPSAFSYGSPDAQPRLDKVESLLKNLRAIMGSERKIYFGTFPSEIRPEHVSCEAMQIMKRYVDNDNIIIGIQSGSEELMKKMGRCADTDIAVRSVETAIHCDFRVNVDFIFGLPGEDDNDREATIRLMRRLSELGANIHAHWFMPLPGTPLENQIPAEPGAGLQKELNRLMTEGKVYGDWRKQKK